jgi:hypothetical protein
LTVRAGTLLLLLLTVSRVHAEDETDVETAGLPRLEAGVLGGAGAIPDYPASDQTHLRWIAAPYVIYRGDILRADREGARARLIRSRWVDLEMSFGGSFPARSENNDARRGMPDLDWMAEVGPRLSIPLFDFPRHRGRVKLFLPFRGVFSSNLRNLRSRGWVAAPALYVRYLWAPEHLWVTEIQSSVGSRPLNAYFYDVPHAYVTSDRPFYDARSGYTGTEVFSGIVVPIGGGRFRILLGGMLGFHQGSANRSSPLFRRETTYGGIAGLSCRFYASKALAQVAPSSQP